MRPAVSDVRVAEIVVESADETRHPDESFNESDHLYVCTARPSFTRVVSKVNDPQQLPRIHSCWSC